MNRDQIVNKLKQGEATVTFTKVNGDRRVMTCTLQEGVIPNSSKTDPLSQKKIREISDKVCAVWDTNAHGWRSFRWDNVETVQ